MGGWGNIDFINGGSGFRAEADFGGGGGGGGAEGQFNALMDPIAAADYFRRTQWQREDKLRRDAQNRAQKYQPVDPNLRMRQAAESEALQAQMAQSRAISRPAPLKMTSGGFNNAQHLEMNDMGMTGAQRQMFLPQGAGFSGPSLSQMDSARSSLTYSPKVGEDPATVAQNAENDAAVLGMDQKQEREQQRRVNASDQNSGNAREAANAKSQLAALQNEIATLRAALAAKGVR